MDNPAISYTAFRVFGAFHWPPLPGKEAEEREEGVVEIHYLSDPNKTDLRAILRWLPRKLLGGHVSTRFAIQPDDVKNIDYLHSLTSADLEARFKSGDEVRLRVDGNPSGAVAAVGERLVFRGARVFDQFLLKPESNFCDKGSSIVLDPTPDLRWVLARRFDQGGATLFSEVVIGQASDTPKTSGLTIRFNLALPTPIAQSIVNGKPVRALPFSVTYPPVAKAPDAKKPKALVAKTFMAGSSDASAISDEEVNPSGIVKSARLGQFGFCRTGGGKDFVYFPRAGSAPPRKRYWLDDQATYRNELLGRLGNVGKLPLADFTFIHRLEAPDDKLGEFWNSVDFVERGARTRMVFRSGIAAMFGLPKGSGDLVVDSGLHFNIRNPDQPSQIIDTKSSRLIVELELDYSLDSANVWDVGTGDVGAPLITARLGFTDSVGTDIGTGQLDADPTKISDTIEVDELFSDAIKGMRLARIDLQHLGAPQPQSILPDVELSGRDVRFALTATISTRFANGGLLDWGRRPPGEAWSGADLKLTLWPKKRFIGQGRARDKREPQNALRATIAPYSFAYEAGAQTVDRFRVELGEDPAASKGQSEQFCQFRLLQPTDDVTKLSGRLGGLEFYTHPGRYLFADQENDADYSHWRFGKRRSITDAADAKRVYPTANVDMRLRFAIASVVPLGIDLPWGDRSGRARPLLIPAGSTGGGDFILDMRELMSEDMDRHLTARLLDRSNGTAAGSAEYVLIGEEPFTVTKFRSAALGNRGTQDNAFVAGYDSDTRSWQLKLVAPNYHYEYPPQVVGESMDKPRRLEITDRPDPEKPAPGVIPPANYPPGLKQRAVEFRLAPSAEIWVEPSDVERGYFLPEWAEYEIFRQTGAYGLGVALAAFRGEFLYGLSVGVDTSREVGAARGARVAEIEALTGRPPGKPGGSNTDVALTQRWESVTRAITRRPQRLEVWNRDFGSASVFAPARFQAGVAFALRDTAVHQPAMALPGASRLNEKASGLPRARDYGLSGGALWGVESRNLFKKLLEAPNSDGGSIERIALSPIGGDADQKAEFLNHQVAIISETRNGFVQRYKVEVLGRIGVFWHRAKHVVVYERTVNPSAQFTPEGGIGERTRRPVLRKVSEYIDMELQPTRSYPDFPSAKPATSGFLHAVRFNSRTINVDSAWSEDVGTYGWKIPLWNRESARRRPQVYPRPDIGFVIHAEGEGDQPLGTQECLEPDNIYFFADFETGGNDTDSWQSRVGIDCSALPAPSFAWQPALKDGANAEGDGRQASALRVPRGHRRFTWRLAPAAQKAALNAGRADEPLYAGLESITFMRSSPVDSGAFGVQLKKGLDQANALVPPAQRLPIWGLDDVAPGLLIGVGNTLKTYLAVAQVKDKTGIIVAATQLKDELSKVPDLIGSGGLKSYADAAESAARGLDELDALLKNAPARCERLADDLLGSLQRRQLLILDSLAAWENDAYALVPPPMQPKKLDDLKKELIDNAVMAIAPALSGLSTDRLGLGNSVEAARSIIRDFESDILAVQNTASARLAELHTAYDDGKPWSDGRIRSVLEKLNAERAGIVFDVGTAIAEAQSRLATELDDLSRRLGAIASEAIAAIGNVVSPLNQELSKIEVAASGALSIAIEKIDTLIAKDGNGKDAFDRADGKLATIEGKAGKYQPRVAQLRTLLTSLKANVSSARTYLLNLQSNVGNTIEALSQTIAQAARTSEGIAAELAAIATEALAIAGAAAADGLDEVKADLEKLVEEIQTSIGATINALSSIGAIIDWAISAIERQVLKTFNKEVFARIASVLKLASDTGDALAGKVAELETMINGDGLVKVLKQHLIEPVVAKLFNGLNDDMLTPYGSDEHDRLIAIVSRFTDTARDEFVALSAAAIREISDALVSTCNALGGGLSNVLGRLQDLGARLIGDAQTQIDLLDKLIKSGDADALINLAKAFDHDIRTISNDLAASYAATTGYAEKVFESVGNLGSGGIAAAPSNILKLYAAVASAPDLPNLSFARERLGYYYGRLNEIIDTTPVEAWFGRLGDELKALGLSLPFDKLTDRLLPEDLSSLDIGRVFKNFGGMKLDQLFKGYKLPKGAGDAIKITHAFDKKLFRAWVQIEVDLPIPGRRSLFSVGPFQLDFVDSRMVGQVRLEASKDSDKIEQTGRASVGTDIEAVVGGQTMVSLRKVAVRFERSSGLKVDFDPKNIKLNAIFQFVQDTLGSLFPDEVGGVKLIKQNGVPVGVEHEFSMPPVDLMFATSGVSNIQISNRFALVAFPDFVISDRFSLSKPDLPFIFSIFVIGGTGYITVDTEYRPFGNQLMVVVEAAAGGSAALGFAFGPVSGSVFISLSVALAYRKLIGSSGGGLTVSLVLLVAGNVSVAGIVTVYIGLLLRMSYRDSGQIDATGTLTLTIRISRFFKISVRANVQYKLRGGRSQVSSSVNSGVEITDKQLKTAKEQADKLLAARG